MNLSPAVDSFLKNEDILLNMDLMKLSIISILSSLKGVTRKKSPIKVIPNKILITTHKALLVMTEATAKAPQEITPLIKIDSAVFQSITKVR